MVEFMNKLNHYSFGSVWFRSANKVISGLYWVFIEFCIFFIPTRHATGVEISLPLVFLPIKL